MRGDRGEGFGIYREGHIFAQFLGEQSGKMVREIHSHAQEEALPGTVNLKAVEGDTTFLGQAVFPVPSTDPKDPLNWPNFKYVSSHDIQIISRKLPF